MLGLGISSAVFGKPFSPNDIDNLVRWYKVNSGIKADEDAEGAISGNHETDKGEMVDGDFISEWKDKTLNSNAVQATSDDKPHWEDDEPGAVKFDNSADMTFSTVTIAANADFTIIFRLKPISFGTDVLMSDGSNDFMRWSDNNSFRVKIGGAGNSNFDDGSATVSTSKYSTIMLVRSNGSTGNLNIYVKASNGSEVDWESGAGNTDTDELTLSMIGAESDDTKSLDAYVKDVLVYNGTALSATERTNMYSYLESQIF